MSEPWVGPGSVLLPSLPRRRCFSSLNRLQRLHRCLRKCWGKDMLYGRRGFRIGVVKDVSWVILCNWKHIMLFWNALLWWPAEKTLMFPGWEKQITFPIGSLAEFKESLNNVLMLFTVKYCRKIHFLPGCIRPGNSKDLSCDLQVPGIVACLLSTAADWCERTERRVATSGIQTGSSVGISVH